jgi:error-prone DNA polymerase
VLTLGKSRAGKGGCTLGWDDVIEWSKGLIAILLPNIPDEVTATSLTQLRSVFGGRGYCARSFRRRPDDAMRL